MVLEDVGVCLGSPSPMPLPGHPPCTLRSSTQTTDIQTHRGGAHGLRHVWAILGVGTV